MEKELDSQVIKSTQTSLGKYVKRPPLSEKLLKKPPFRFLHDIVTTVLKTTGFFENLFDDEELISDNVKDRDSKISFLTKVIFVISSTTGKSLSVKPSKIVSGQEPEKTNELLQCLAQALDSKLSSENAVKQYKENLKLTTESKNKESNKTLKKGTDAKKITSRSTEKLNNQHTTKQVKEKYIDVKATRKDTGSSKSDAQNKKTQPSKTVIKKNLKEQGDDNTQSRNKTLTPKATEKDSKSNTEKDRQSNTGKDVLNLSKRSSQESDVSIEKDHPGASVSNIDSPITKENDQENLNTSYTINENGLDSSASSTVALDTPNFITNENNITNIRVNTTENTSLAKDYTKEISLTEIRQHNIDQNEGDISKSLEIAPDVSDKSKDNSVGIKRDNVNKGVELKKGDYVNDDKTSAIVDNDVKIMRQSSVRPSSVRPSSSRPGAPRMREKIDNVIKDPDNILMGKVNIIVENTQNEEEDDSSLLIIDQSGTMSATQDAQELQLTSSEHGHLVQQILESQKELSQNSGKTEIEWQLGAQKAREAVNQDIEQLRFSIQALSRVTNPLGKLLDHIQEDVEVMRQELQQWTKIYEDVNKDMLKQKTLTEDALTPFHIKLKQLEADIDEKHDKINDLKILIHKNATRIEKLLGSGNVQ